MAKLHIKLIDQGFHYNNWMAESEKVVSAIEILLTLKNHVGSIPTQVNKIFQSFLECVRWKILC